MKGPDARLTAAPEFRVLKRLRSPRTIQDFLEKIPINHERNGETCTSPLVTLRRRRAHCMEGALVAALALWMHGHPPLIMDLKTTDDDVDHLVVVFKSNGCWGGITKTNHAVLRYREPIFRDLHSLAASYFHEYFLPNGKKTLRAYSEPFDLRKYKGDWINSEDDLWELETAIDRSPHKKILTRAAIARLRPADPVEIKAGKLTQW